MARGIPRRISLVGLNAARGERHPLSRPYGRSRPRRRSDVWAESGLGLAVAQASATSGLATRFVSYSRAARRRREGARRSSGPERDFTDSARARPMPRRRIESIRRPASPARDTSRCSRTAAASAAITSVGPRAMPGRLQAMSAPGCTRPRIPASNVIDRWRRGHHVAREHVDWRVAGARRPAHGQGGELFFRADHLLRKVPNVAALTSQARARGCSQRLMRRCIRSAARR